MRKKQTRRGHKGPVISLTMPFLSHKLHHEWEKVVNLMAGNSYRHVLVVIAVFAIGITMQTVIYSAPPTSRNQIVCTYGGIPITSKQIDDLEIDRVQHLVSSGQYVGTPEDRQHISDYVFVELFDQIERSRQIQQVTEPNNHDVRQRVPNNQISQIAPLPSVTDNEAQLFYSLHPSLFATGSPEVHVREIVVADADLAYRIYEQLKQEVSFNDLAWRYSLDPVRYRNTGGDMGWIHSGQMPSDWDRAASSLRTGQTSPILHIADKYFILQAIDQPKVAMRPFDSTTAKVVAANYEQRQRYLAWLSARVSQEPIIINISSYSEPIHTVLKDLGTIPDQLVLDMMR